jgi:hypothetical protein
MVSFPATSFPKSANIVFYEALGGKMIKESQFEIAGVTRCEVAYGWLDIRTILKGQ